jgi:hypothetical protein
MSAMTTANHGRSWKTAHAASTALDTPAIAPSSRPFSRRAWAIVVDIRRTDYATQARCRRAGRQGAPRAANGFDAIHRQDPRVVTDVARRILWPAERGRSDAPGFLGIVNPENDAVYHSKGDATN